MIFSVALFCSSFFRAEVAEWQAIDEHEVMMELYNRESSSFFRQQECKERTSTKESSSEQDEQLAGNGSSRDSLDQTASAPVKKYEGKQHQKKEKQDAERRRFGGKGQGKEAEIIEANEKKNRELCHKIALERAVDLTNGSVSERREWLHPSKDEGILGLQANLRKAVRLLAVELYSAPEV